MTSVILLPNPVPGVFESHQVDEPDSRFVRLRTGTTPLPYPLQAGQTGAMIRDLGVKGLHNVPMAGVLFGTQYFQIPLDSLDRTPDPDDQTGTKGQ